MNIDGAREYAASAGVDYLVLGSMTQFSAESRRRTYGGGVVVPLLAGVRRNRIELVVGITVRVVDVRSGEVATTATAQGIRTARRSGRSLGPLLARRGRRVLERVHRVERRPAQRGHPRAVATAAQGIINSGSRLTAQGSGGTD